MKLESPTSGERTGLDFDTCESNSSTKPTILNTSHNGKMVLEQLARKWVSRGYLSTPSKAMWALLEGAI